MLKILSLKYLSRDVQEYCKKKMKRSLLKKELFTYLDSIKVENVLVAPYQTQSQGSIETFYKTVQRSLSKAL